MGQGAIDYIGVKGGLDINGIIEDYYVYAGENVNAGDFVEFINGIAGQTIESSTDTAIGERASDGENISAVALSENKVFIAHNSNQSGQNGIYGVVCTISVATITVGTDTKICTGGRYEGIMFSVTKLEDNKVFIAHRNDNYIYGLVCTISSTTITVGTDTQLSTVAYSMLGISTVLLPSGKVFVSHSGEKAYYLYGMVCTISGTTITVGTDTRLSTTTNTIEVASAKLLPNGNVFIAHNYGSDTSYGYLYGIVTTISGTTITAGTDTQLSTTKYAGKRLSALVLENGNVFIAHCYNLTNYQLYGMVCTISGTTITKGTDTALSTNQYAGYLISTSLLPNNGVLIVHSSSTDYYLYGMICRTSGTTITKGTDTQLNSTKLSGRALSAVLLNDNVFVAHSYPYPNSSNSSWVILYSQLFGIDEINNIPTNQVKVTEYETQVKKATTLPCNGVASTSGEGGDETGHKDIVSIYKPPYSIYNLITNGDFSNGLDNWKRNSTTDIATYSVQYGIATITYSTASTGTNNITLYQLISCKKNHKYYVSTYCKAQGIAHVNFYALYLTASTQNQWELVSGIVTTNENASASNFIVGLKAGDGNNATVGDNCQYKQVKLYDLTEMFGAGNEPTQEWCDANL